MDKGLNFKKKTNLKFLFFKYTFKWEDISEEKKLPPNIVEAALREALLKGYEKYRRTFYIGINEDPFDEEYFSNFDVGLDLDEEGYRVLSSKIIVEEVESEDHQISLVEVKQVAEDAQIGDTVVLDVTPEKDDFGRMAAKSKNGKELCEGR